MIDALTATTGGMVDDMARLNAISHNLANSGTAGFKKQVLVSRPFLEYLRLAGASEPPANFPVGLPRTETITDHRPGTVKFTGNPMDVAIEDDGFFEVMTDHGPAYTRQGSFRLDVQGRLVTEAGMPVAGTSGEIFLKTSGPVILQSGKILENDREVGQIRLARFADPGSLEHIGNGLYLAGSASTLKNEGYDRIRQGYTEASNVNSMTEMVKMIETMRHFESSQRIVQGYDEMLDKTIRTLGEF